MGVEAWAEVEGAMLRASKGSKDGIAVAWAPCPPWSPVLVDFMWTSASISSFPFSPHQTSAFLKLLYFLSRANESNDGRKKEATKLKQLKG